MVSTRTSDSAISILMLFVDHREDRDAWRTRYAGAHWNRTANSHQPMHAGFGFQPAIGVVTADLDGGRLDAGFFALVSSRYSILKPCFSAQRVYIRSSIEAQSWLSVPPAPAWTSR